MDMLLYQKMIDTWNLQRKLTTERNVLNSVSNASTSKSKAKYDDTSSTVFTEGFNDLTNWVLYGTPGMQISGNKLYSTGSGGGNSGANHSYALGSNENLRAVFKLTIPSGEPSGGLIIGVSKDATGAIPTAGGANAFGLYVRGTTNATSKWDSSPSNTIENIAPTVGDYIITVTVDQTYISVVMVKSDNTLEISARRLRSGFSVNNLYIFNSDTRALGGMYVSLVSARKGLSTIYPRSYGEGISKTIQWTGDGIQSFRIYLPVNYDSRVPSPLAICFHGNGSNENAWELGGADSNYAIIQQSLVNAGYIVIGCSYDASQTTWGNSYSTNAYYQAYKYVRDNYAIGSIVFFANSMGGIESLNTLSENKIPCVAWAGSAPTVSLKNNYDVNFGSLIKTAYGILSDGSDYDAKTVGRDPNLMQGSVFRGIPMWMAAAPDDTAVSKTENMDKLASKVASTSLELIKVDVASGGHQFSLSPYVTQIVNFFNKYTGL